MTDHNDGHAPGWVCPWCGNDETYFDRSILVDGDGNEIEGMKDRCTGCGRADDDIPAPDKRQVGLISRILASITGKFP